MIESLTPALLSTYAGRNWKEYNCYPYCSSAIQLPLTSIAKQNLILDNTLEGRGAKLECNNRISS